MTATLMTDLTVEDICKGFVYNELEGKGLFGWGGRLVIQPDIPVNNSMFDRVIDGDSKSFWPILVINSAATVPSAG